MNTCICKPHDCEFWFCREHNVCLLSMRDNTGIDTISSLSNIEQQHTGAGRKFSGWRKRRNQKIFDRDGNKCLECGSTDNLTIDHIKPKAKGGKNTQDNLQTLCKSCNGKKADKY